MLPASSPDHPERQARRALIRGVYAITADEGDTTRLLADVEAALSGASASCSTATSMPTGR